MAASDNGKVVATERIPRRLVLLRDGDGSEVETVLQEYRGSEVSGRRLHGDLQKCAAEQAGRTVAAEWLGPLGWMRFMWCQK